VNGRRYFSKFDLFSTFLNLIGLVQILPLALFYHAKVVGGS